MTAKEKDAVLLAIKENRFRELTEADKSNVLELESCMYIAVTRTNMGNAHKLLGLGEKVLNDGGFAGIESKAKKAKRNQFTREVFAFVLGAIATKLVDVISAWLR